MRLLALLLAAAACGTGEVRAFGAPCPLLPYTRTLAPLVERRGGLLNDSSKRPLAASRELRPRLTTTALSTKDPSRSLEDVEEPNNPLLSWTVPVRRACGCRLPG